MHELRLHKEPRFTGTGTADDQHVFVPGCLGVLGPAVHSSPSYEIPMGTLGIGAAAFRDCDELTAITIPDSVTTIGDEAFLSCNNITAITIPNSVTSIGDRAFSGCKLSSITIPESVTVIGGNPFTSCK